MTAHASRTAADTWYAAASTTAAPWMSTNGRQNRRSARTPAASGESATGDTETASLFKAAANLAAPTRAPPRDLWILSRALAFEATRA
jgi:hypothetical protein